MREVKNLKEKKTKRAIILAAGFGMRMVPINTEIPKGLLEVHGEPLIERIIRQLNEVRIEEIYVIVGFMKEKYEYLVDKFGVKLIYNSDYASKNNLYSLKLAKKYLNNTYIIPCDIWCKKNPFSCYESSSWYMVSDLLAYESNIKVNENMIMDIIPTESKGNTMIGIAYLIGDVADIVKQRLEKLTGQQRFNDSFWEETLYGKKQMIIPAKIVCSSDIVEINTYEQLRSLDDNSNQLKTEAIHVICNLFNVNSKDIINIDVLKKGMTNRSFLFSCKGKKYIMRIPGEGTDKLINRKYETDVYNVIKEKNICDNVAYINPQNGYKITEFIEGARVCDPFNYDDVKKCMKMLKKFHNLKLKVDHDFDIFQQIEFYENLRKGIPSIYEDYNLTKSNVFSLKKYIEKEVHEKVLTHIDAVPDNFLFVKRDKKEEIRLIDWEYAGMQDPHVDIAMFAIYSLYNRAEIDKLIEAYFVEGCPKKTKIKIYCYIAACGLLWSNWCEYKRSLGVDFGDYSLKQYEYAREYYEIVKKELTKER